MTSVTDNGIGNPLFGMAEARRLVEAGQDGWYAIGNAGMSNSTHFTIFSLQAKTPVATRVYRPHAMSIVASHNAPLLEMLNHFDAQPD